MSFPDDAPIYTQVSPSIAGRGEMSPVERQADSSRTEASTLACTAFHSGALRSSSVGRAFKARANGLSHTITRSRVQVTTEAMQVTKPCKQESALSTSAITMALAKPEPSVPTTFKAFLEATSHSIILGSFPFLVLVLLTSPLSRRVKSFEEMFKC